MYHLETRSEYKFKFNNFEYERFMFDISKEIENLYPRRCIHSLYFDTENFDLYRQQIFNDINKYKIRVRRYDSKNSFTKEIKLNNPSGKFKISEKLDIVNFFEINEIIFDNKIFYPKLFVRYNREYYKYRGSRITVDTSITYEDYIYKNSNLKIETFDLVIVEFKKNKQESYNVLNDLPENHTQFSKYEDAVSKLYLIN